MKGSSNVPQAPDPYATADAQTQQNIQTALANARLNRTNQTTPWGSINWTQGEVDANGVPTYSSQVTLNPQDQAILDAQRSSGLTRQQLIQQLLANSGGSLSQPLRMDNLHPVYDRYAQGGQGGQAQGGGAQGGTPQISGISGAAAGGMGLPQAQGASQASQPGGSPDIMAQVMAGAGNALSSGMGTSAAPSSAGVPFSQIMPGGGAPQSDPAALAQMAQMAQQAAQPQQSNPLAGQVSRKPAQNPILAKTLAALLRGGRA